MAFLTDRSLATGVTLNDLIHIVITGDTSQGNPAGSSYKAKISQVFDSITGYCITDLYVSNIHSCSPLNINPLDEGNVYFGSTSAVTIDLANNRLGVGIANPTAKLHINNTTSGNTFLVEDDTNPDSTPFVIDSIGRVGIGTPTPAVALQISGNANSVRYEGIDHVYQEYYPQGISAGRFGFIGYETSGSTNLNVFNQVSGGKLIFGTEFNPRMYISSSGNVGIGNSNPTQRLQIAISGSSTIGGTSLSGSTLLVGTINNGIGIDNNELFNAGNEFIIGTLGSNSISFRPNSTPRMVISSSGDVGIGITSPTAKLHINNLNAGNSFLVEDSTNPDSTPFVIDSIGRVGIGITNPGEKVSIVDGNQFIWGSGNTNTGLRLQYGLGTSFWINTPSGGTMSIGGIGTSAPSSGVINITSTGNVGIGTTTPSKKLHVSGNTIISSGLTATTLNISSTPTTDTGTTLNYLTRDGSTGEVKVKTIPGPTVYGLFSQTGTSVAVSATTVETTLISGGVGSIIIPANGFSVGDGFHGVLIGHLSCVGSATLHIRIKTDSGVLLAETGVMAMNATTNKHWKLDVNFTIRQLGVASVGSIASGGLFSYTKNGGLDFEGVNFSIVNNTTFDTTISNTLLVTAEWNTNNAGNSIYSEIFTLNKIY